jgi:SAM-dependent methyltransferase
VRGQGSPEPIMTSDSISKRFPAPLVHRLAASLPTAANAESAIPSYTHKIPMIRWLMFRRLDVIRKMALKELKRNRSGAGPAALDFGCGIGMMIPALGPSVKTLYLCDEQLTPARATAEWFHADNVACVPPEELGRRIQDSSLDIVIAADVLEHVDDLAGVLDTLRRKIRAQGALIVSGPTENWAYRCGRKVAGFTGEYHVRGVSEVEEAVESAAFAREELRHLPFSFGPALFRISLWRRPA